MQEVMANFFFNNMISNDKEINYISEIIEIINDKLSNDGQIIITQYTTSLTILKIIMLENNTIEATPNLTPNQIIEYSIGYKIKKLMNHVAKEIENGNIDINNINTIPKELLEIIEEGDRHRSRQV